MTFKYKVIEGFFEQDEPDTDPNHFDYSYSFGLIRQDGLDDWFDFRRRIADLNQHVQCGQRYVVLFLGRHGQGWHNVAESKYGTRAWDDTYSKLNEHDGMTFLDARLTDTGRAQAQTASDTWKVALAEGLEAPETYYVSPLDRCLETCSITFNEQDLPTDRPFLPHVKEHIREVIGEHTCDKRSSRSVISHRYPSFVIEDGLSEEDKLWRADWRENDTDVDKRLCQCLNDILERDSSTYISITSHSGAIASILRVIGHRIFPLQTGGVIPVVLQITPLHQAS